MFKTRCRNAFTDAPRLYQAMKALFKMRGNHMVNHQSHQMAAGAFFYQSLPKLSGPVEHHLSLEQIMARDGSNPFRLNLSRDVTTLAEEIGMFLHHSAKRD